MDIDGEPCGVYVRGQHSRYTTAFTTERLSKGATETSVHLPEPFPAGTLVHTRQWATNKAGLASVVQSDQVIMLDDTPPTHPSTTFCTEGGRYGDDREVFYQASDAGVAVCWAALGFDDQESGVWRLEWQLARRVGFTWDTLSTTLQLTEAETLASNRDGRLLLTKEALAAAVGADFLVHPNRLRLGLRAVNRAGLRSCASCASQPCSCERLVGPNAARTTAESIAAVAHEAVHSPWAIATGMEAVVDATGPVCAYASAWLCDPHTSSSSSLPARCHDIALDQAIGDAAGAGGGFQAAQDRLHVQWEGFTDEPAGINRCRLDVVRVEPPGKTRLGQRCICSAAMPNPSCDCAPSESTGALARCELVTERLQAIAQSHPWAWRASFWTGAAATITEEQEFAWSFGLLELEADELDQISVCVPAESTNLGPAAVSEACQSMIECAPLTPFGHSVVHPAADPSVACVASASVPWLVRVAERFCCGIAPSETETGVCLPAALVRDDWRVLPSWAPHPVAAIGEVPEPTCLALQLEVRLVTGDGVFPHEYTHISWDVDSAVFPPPFECSPDLCANSSEACGCLYRRSSVYVHSACLTPGRHALNLRDAMGFGWFGANVSLHQAGLGVIDLIDASNENVTVTHADVHTYPQCHNECAGGGVVGATPGSACVHRLFDGADTNLCGEMRDSTGCACEGCCLESLAVRSAWRSRLPSPSRQASPYWGGAACTDPEAEPSPGEQERPATLADMQCSAVRKRTLYFELFDHASPQKRLAVQPATRTLVANMTVACASSGVQETAIDGLDLVHGAAYAVVVTPIDRADNEVTGCGMPGQSRGRHTSDMPWQRAVIIDATPPVNRNASARVRDVNLFARSHEPAVLPHEEADTDALRASPLHAACDWSEFDFEDAESGGPGGLVFQWALSSNGVRPPDGWTRGRAGRPSLPARLCAAQLCAVALPLCSPLPPPPCHLAASTI